MIAKLINWMENPDVSRQISNNKQYKLLLTVHLSHSTCKICRVFKADEAESFRFIGTVISYHLCLLKRWVFPEYAC